MFMGQAERSAAKPLCISAQTLRARARTCMPGGQRALAGNFSATYSAMASVSQTTKPSSTSTGTLPTGVTSLMVFLKLELLSNESKRTLISSNAMSACLSSTQGRIDQEE